MSSERRRILVVSESLALANSLLVWLREGGYDPAVVTSFNAGKEYLRNSPDILITELKLREYNGLHLALRAHHKGIPTAVIGGSDPSFAEDAAALGARYVVRDTMDRSDILLLIDGLLSAGNLGITEDHPMKCAFSTATDTDEQAQERTWPFGSTTGTRGGRTGSQSKVVIH